MAELEETSGDQQVRPPEELLRTPRKISSSLIRRTWLTSLPVIIASCVVGACFVIGTGGLLRTEGSLARGLTAFLITSGVVSPLLIYAVVRCFSVSHSLRLARDGRISLARVTRQVTDRYYNVKALRWQTGMTRYTATFVADNGKPYERTFNDEYAQHEFWPVEQGIARTSAGEPLQRVLIFYAPENPDDNITINEFGMFGGGGAFVPGVGLTVRYQALGFGRWWIHGIAGLSAFAFLAALVLRAAGILVASQS